MELTNYGRSAMPDRIQTDFGPVDIPSVDELRATGRERLMTHFLGYGATPPDDLDAMAQAAHELLAKHAPETAAFWDEAMRNGKWIPAEDVMTELGIDLDAESPDESAA
jgi:hypothetical protein